MKTDLFRLLPPDFHHLFIGIKSKAKTSKKHKNYDRSEMRLRIMDCSGGFAPQITTPFIGHFQKFWEFWFRHYTTNRAITEAYELLDRIRGLLNKEQYSFLSPRIIKSICFSICCW